MIISDDDFKVIFEIAHMFTHFGSVCRSLLGFFLYKGVLYKSISYPFLGTDV